MLCPMLPARTGNGLAMRLWAWVCGAARRHDVDLFVVPVWGSTPAVPVFPAGVTVHHLAPVDPVDGRDLVAWAADPVWRDRLGWLQPLPEEVRRAAPVLAASILRELRADPDLVLTCRLVLGPLGLAVAERTGARWVLDLDDDEQDFHRETSPELAAAVERLTRLCVPAADVVSLAAPRDAAAAADRFGPPTRVVQVPNCVSLGAPEGFPPPPGAGRLLLVGNLTYRPNVAGACWFVEHVLPLLSPRWTLDLVGTPAPEVAALAGPRVRVRGWLPDLTEAYARADVVVVPLQRGSGTRIKVLEAAAWSRPVVATAVGAAGLGLADGSEILLADTPPAFAAAVERAGDPHTGSALARAARAATRTRHGSDNVHATIDELLRRVAAR
jgi:glycosyltransferase involved in cell wall biosynthesis